MEVKINTDSIKVLEDFFSGLSSIDQKKIFTAGFRKAAKPLIEMARANVPKRSGRLYRSIGSVEMPDDIAILIGAKKAGIPSNKGWHGHLVENSTVERFRRSKHNAPTGRTIGTHFFENAFNAVEEKMYGSIEQEWYNEIDKFIIRTNKKAKK
jgi:hypothetical protein